MATRISLNNQAFWTPPVSHPVQPRRVHSPRPLANQSRVDTSPVHGRNTLPPNDAMVISSDEDSDSNATENDDDQDDHLPSIAEIVSRLNESERSCSNAAVGSAAVSVAADPPSVESRRSSVAIQPRGSPAAGSHQAELSPETAANARAPTPAPISPVATVPCEDEQLNHGGEMKSCEPRRPSIVYENAHQPASRISQDTPKVAKCLGR